MKWPWVSRRALEAVEAALAQALQDKRIAEDRLYAAWKDQNIIPPRESVLPRPPVEIKLLPEKLDRYVQNWESAEVRQEIAAEVRRLHYDLHYPEDRVIELIEARRDGGSPLLEAAP